MAKTSVYTFRGQPCASLKELAEAFLDSPATADKHVKRGYLERWLVDDVRDFDSAASIAELMERKWATTGAVTLSAMATIAPHVPLRWGDLDVGEAALTRTALAALGTDETAEDARADLASVRAAVAEALPYLVTLDPSQRATLERWTEVSTQVSSLWKNQLVADLRQYAEQPADSSRTLKRNPQVFDDEVPDALAAYAMLVATRHPTMDDVVAEVDGWFDDGPFAHTGVREAFWAIDRDAMLVAATGALCERASAPKRALYKHWMLGREIAADGTLGALDAWLAVPTRGDVLDRMNLVECASIALAQNDDVDVVNRLLNEVIEDPIRDPRLRWYLMQGVAQFGTVMQLERLLAKGFEVDSGADGTVQPLHVAAARSRFPDLVRALGTSKGARLEARTEHGLTPLALAAADNPELGVVRALLDMGADVDARVPEGKQRTWTLRDGRKVDVAGRRILDLARAYNPNSAVAALLSSVGATAAPSRSEANQSTPPQRRTWAATTRSPSGDQDLWIGVVIGSLPLLIAVFHPGWAFIGAGYIAINATVRYEFYYPGQHLSKRAWGSMSVTSGIWIVITLLWAFARFGS